MATITSTPRTYTIVIDEDEYTWLDQVLVYAIRSGLGGESVHFARRFVDALHAS